MFCPKCGTTLEFEADFCTRCGRKVAHDSEANSYSGEGTSGLPSSESAGGEIRGESPDSFRPPRESASGSGGDVARVFGWILLLVGVVIGLIGASYVALLALASLPLWIGASLLLRGSPGRRVGFGLMVAVVVLFGTSAWKEAFDAWVERHGAESTATPEEKFWVGDVFKSPGFEVSVTEVTTTDRVGNQYLLQSAPEGSRYVVVRYTIKNVSDAPVSMWSRPTVHLTDPSGHEYGADVAATIAFAASTTVDEKSLSDLNPGIQTRGAQVFNVATARYSPEHWQVLVKADTPVYFGISRSTSADRNGADTASRQTDPSRSVPETTPVVPSGAEADQGGDPEVTHTASDLALPETQNSSDPSSSQSQPPSTDERASLASLAEPSSPPREDLNVPARLLTDAEPAQPETNNAYRPGNGVTLPRILREVRPNYTADGIRAKVQGTVWVEAVVLPDGSVGQARVVRSLDSTFGLDEEALKAARQWRFAPGTRYGQPVAVLVTIELTFTLR